MKRKVTTATAISAVFALMVSASGVQAAQPLRVGTSLTQMPWGFYDEQQKPTGIDVSICSAVAEQMGDQAEFTNLDYKGLVPALQAGRFDIVCAAMYITPEREKAIAMVPYLTASQTVITQQSATIKGLDDLCGHSVSVLQGSGSLKVLQETSSQCEAAGSKAIAIQSFDTQPVAIRALENGSVEAFIATDSLISFYMKRNANLKKIATGISPMTLGIGVPQADQARAEQIKQALVKLKASGQYDAILKQWGIESAGIALGE